MTCFALRKRIFSLENTIKKSYEKRKKDKEDKIFIKSKENINVLYRYIKSKQKSKSKVGPFLDEKGKVINLKECESLSKQYQSVFSTPMVNKLINDKNDFFKPICPQCLEEKVHILFTVYLGYLQSSPHCHNHHNHNHN